MLLSLNGGAVPAIRGLHAVGLERAPALLQGRGRERAPLLSALPMERQLCAGNRDDLGTCKAPGCGNLGALAARLREQARRGTHNAAVATDRDSTAAFIVFFFPSRLRLRSAMAQVTSVSDEDVLRWSRNLLDRRKVPDLDNFIRLRGGRGASCRSSRTAPPA